MSETDQDAVRSCIRSYLMANGLTNNDLADRLGLSLNTVNNYLSTKHISERTLGKIAKVLDYPLALLRDVVKYYGPNAYEQL